MSTTFDRTSAGWVKSSYSGNGGGSCLEWVPSATSGVIPVRDSKTPDGPHLNLSPRAFSGLVELARKADV